MGYTGLLYHEKQVAALCGVHCLNSLLQGTYFDEMSLAEIAQEVDRKEQAIMAEGGMDTEEYQKFIKEGSHNVSLDGNFNVQVLSDALAVFDLKALRYGTDATADARRNPTDEEAFVCNLAEHWLCIRKVHGSWFNFNSVYSAPEPLSDFYLAAFLDSLVSDGYTIFVIRGNLPAVQPVDPSSPLYKNPRTRVSNTGMMQIDATSDPELAAVLKASLEDNGYTADQDRKIMEQIQQQSLDEMYQQEQREKHEAQRQQRYAQLQSQATTTTSTEAPIVIDSEVTEASMADTSADEEELQRAIALSMAQESIPAAQP